MPVSSPRLPHLSSRRRPHGPRRDRRPGAARASTTVGRTRAAVLGAAAGLMCLAPALAGVTPRPAEAADAQPMPRVLAANFNSLGPVGPVRGRSFSALLGRGVVSPWQPNYEDMSVVRAADHGLAVRTRLERNTIRSRPAGNNGAVLELKLPGRYEQACLSYTVRFNGDFDWSRGGKLPGLVGVAPGVRASEPTGGGRSDRGFSSRVMWVGPQAYPWAKTKANPHNMAVMYLYDASRAGQWGDNVATGRSFQRDQWASVKQCITLNTPGRANGQLQVWFDGQRVTDRHDVIWRNRGDVKISHVYWNVFRGGNTMSWASPRTDTIDLDRLVVRAS